MIDWIKCSERMPEYDQEVLILYEGDKEQAPIIYHVKFIQHEKPWLEVNTRQLHFHSYEVDNWAEINLPEDV